MITSTNTSKSYLLKLSIPFLIANMAIPFVGLVDTALMGHLSNEKFLAAISIATSVVTMILWSFGFLRMSTVGLVSQALGSKNHNEAILILVRNIILASFKNNEFFNSIFSMEHFLHSKNFLGQFYLL